MIRKLTTTLEDNYSSGEARAMAKVLLSHITGLSMASLMAERELTLSEFQKSSLDSAVMRLMQGEPLQYVLGTADFYGRMFAVDERVLIPRPETEELVHQIISDFCSEESVSIIDIGTGSGCIAISLAAELDDAKVVAVDVSSAALELASLNAKVLEADVAFVRSDVLKWCDTRYCHNWELPCEVDRKFDVVVSNPPYIRQSEMNDMEMNVVEFEPHRALFVPDADPLVFYRIIGKYAFTNLTERGRLYFEINQALGDETCNLLRDLGFDDVRLMNDINDNPRMVMASRRER